MKNLKSVVQWVSNKTRLFVLKLRVWWVERELRERLYCPWGRWSRDPFAFGPPFTTALRFGDEYGYRIFLWHLTAIRRRIADWGSYAIVVLGLYHAFQFIFIQRYLTPVPVDDGPRLWTIYAPAAPAFSGDLLFALFLFGVFTALCVMIWRLLCRKITPLKITPTILKVGWFGQSCNAALISEFDAEPYCSVFSVSMQYAGQKCVIAEIYGYEKAEALCHRLSVIQEFLSLASRREIQTANELSGGKNDGEKIAA